MAAATTPSRAENGNNNSSVKDEFLEENLSHQLFHSHVSFIIKRGRELLLAATLLPIGWRVLQCAVQNLASIY